MSASLLWPILGVVLVLGVSREARAQTVWHGSECTPRSQNPVPAGAAADARAPRIDVDVVKRGAYWVATLTARYVDGSTGTRRIQAESCDLLERAVNVSLSLLEAASAPPADAPSAVPPRSAAAATGSAVTTSSAAESRNGATAPALRSSATASANASASASAVPARSSVAAGGVAPELAEATRDSSASSVADAPPGDQGTALAARSPSAPRGFIRAAALVASAGTSFAEVGAALAGGLWFGPWGGRVVLGGRRPLSQVSAEHDISIELLRLSAALDVCTRAPAMIAWGFCAGPRIDRVSGLSSGPTDPASDAVWLPGVEAGAWLLVPVGRDWALSGELQGSWSLRGAEAYVQPWGSVYELPRLGVSLLVGAEWAP